MNSQARDELEKRSKTIARVAQGSLCSGCGACAAVAPDKIKMVLQDPGFLRPQLSDGLSDEEDETIARICPGMGQSVEANGRADDVIWGPYLHMHTGHAIDPQLRFAGSSGGALSAVILHLLDSGQIDHVLQTGPSETLPTANKTFLSDTREEILSAAGSRYAPSAPLAELDLHLATGKKFALVGKPCDIAALRALAKFDPRIDAQIPFMLSFFCAGVPSLTGSGKVLDALGARVEEVRAFRYRGNGWPGKATAILHDGETHSMSYHESWGGILSSHVQHRCKICADGSGTAADLVCADAWTCDADGYPLFEEQDGISLIVTRTKVGESVLQGAVDAGVLAIDHFNNDQLATMQPGQTNRRRALLARLAGLWILRKPIPHYRGLHLLKMARQNTFARNSRNFLGMLRRGFTGRI
ncbi:hypothetical protein GCM10016455_29600 [Aliiroseovarius zhejiangensis]|uniref:4Fe-4S ferredoxin-type domain-containing protein n=2 Tax=Aliiroseovarius zhejiangensis TaxID=1632025 RepID=A0ABQ3J616_9RHOB|nr:hypothetical protein GCM10016455_29600 [Aliiroseovarius zhejiangensis]